jgi:hypothetical protein
MIRNKNCDICGREKQEVYDFDCKCGRIFYMCHYCYRDMKNIPERKWKCKLCQKVENEE